MTNLLEVASTINISNFRIDLIGKSNLWIEKDYLCDNCGGINEK